MCPDPTTPAPSPNPTRKSLRNELGPISNAALYLGFCLLAGTGSAMLFRLEDGRATLLGLVRQDWALVHAVAALSVLSLVALHLWLNWPWIRSMVLRLRWPTVVIALLGLAMIAVALLAPAHP
jgi:hypothetical protein